MKDLNQLLLNFNYNQNFNYDDFFVSKSNYFAFELIEKWPHWEKNILNIYGEKFSGKSHLANIFYKKNKGKKISENQLNDEIFKELKLHENIILDDFNNNKEQKFNKKLCSVREIFEEFNLISAIHSFMAQKDKSYINLLPPLSILNNNDQKRLFEELKKINFNITNLKAA